MTTLTDELERFRQQMIEDARENEVELVRLAADLRESRVGPDRSTAKRHPGTRAKTRNVYGGATRLCRPDGTTKYRPSLTGTESSSRRPRLGYASGKLAGHGSERREICELARNTVVAVSTCALSIKR